MRKEVFLAVPVALVLGMSAWAAARGLTADSQPQPPPDTTLKIQPLGEKLPSEKAREELSSGYRVLSEAIALLQNVAHPRIQKEAQLLARWFGAKMVFPVLYEQPETIDFKASRGRFPGTLVVWGGQDGLQVQVPLSRLLAPGISLENVAFNLMVNWRFARNLEGSSESLTADSVAQLLENALEEVRADFQKAFQIADTTDQGSGK